LKKIILSGIYGNMGRVLTNLIKHRKDCIVIAGIDKEEDLSGEIPVFNTPERAEIEADVLIDFSHPSLLENLLNFCVKKNLSTVLCTTGFSAKQYEEIKKTSKKIPIFCSGNMSLGINLMTELCKIAAEFLGKDFNIEIIEKHHNKKLDAPSGTALMLADSMNTNYNYNYNRSLKREARKENEIGIHSIRGGTIVGEHEVIFAGYNEILKITHVAQSKEIFAVGAINAALFLCDKPAGLYNMSDIKKLKN